ncbi:DUF1289 domain-containing protein [Shewanella salipaludis]|uniref:DUF1289 domain-containing protein n=1 Tax=Shewanella salipaludis TaxID=2723052 RepID=A0A972FQV3_9GAMM|nr:DUF1289 domain-containing protein [Shewanella salipaludis]NMH64488.1 DUF1289 domain-containing protein [Shewanella salipaludis]
MHSPCVARCGLDDNDYCMGCFRHIDEIVTWGSASDARKAEIWAGLAERKARLAGGDNCQTLSRQKWLEAEARLATQELE